MNRHPSSLRPIAAAVAVATTSESVFAMSYHLNHWRGNRPHSIRGYSTYNPSDSESEVSVSGDSHFRAVQDANRGFRPSYNAVPPPLQYFAGNQFNGPRPGPYSSHQFGAGPSRHPHPQQVGPPIGNYQQFRPQAMQQNFRPRPSKPADYREWEYAKPVPPPHCERFTVLSYNILADYLANDHWQNLYFHIPRHMLDWNWRRRSISFELGLWSADILCFQEVDRFQDIEAELKHRGYSGIWKMRTGDPLDGCAIFWRLSRFKLLHEESIEYNKLGLRNNVAQICVFESLNKQTSASRVSSFSTSSLNSNRVVVCNIHVLFNPKRGDIKLGQIRVLLDRANAVSKLWDDAPVVICGDFNCTPKSPIYNFISEQKLDLTELPRDKASGQASAEIRRSRPPYPDSRAQSAHRGVLKGSFTGSQSVKSLALQPIYEGAHSRETSGRGSDEFNLETLPEPSGTFNSDASQSEKPSDSFSRKALDVSSSESPAVDLSVSAVESASHESTSANHLLDEKFDSLSLNESVNETKDELHAPGTFISDASQSEKPSDSFSLKALDVSSSESPTVDLSVSVVESASHESTSANHLLDEKFDSLSLNESVNETKDELHENCDSFLSELHSTDQTRFPSNMHTSSQNHELHSRGNENLNDALYVKDEGVIGGQSPYNPSAWTPMEIETATGNADCMVMEHPLKLSSAYAEVKTSSGLRDSSGEPQVTSYHRGFLGTVDYIWHSEGLQTSKVLAPIPKHVMQYTQGFPTKKWGSDHIALVSEFAFTKDSR